MIFKIILRVNFSQMLIVISCKNQICRCLMFVKLFPEMIHRIELTIPEK
jgi:hypothetical protein